MFLTGFCFLFYISKTFKNCLNWNIIMRYIYWKFICANILLTKKANNLFLNETQLLRTLFLFFITDVYFIFNFWIQACYRILAFIFACRLCYIVCVYNFWYYGNILKILIKYIYIFDIDIRYKHHKTLLIKTRFIDNFILQIWKSG